METGANVVVIYVDDEPVNAFIFSFDYIIGKQQVTEC